MSSKISVISSPGEVVGGADIDGDEVFYGFVWKNGVMTALQPLPGDCFNIAIRINSKPQILGTSYSRDFSCSKGVLWENGSVTDLNTFVPPESGLDVVGDDLFLNDRGEIAGNGLLPNGDVRFFTLTPVNGNATSGAAATVTVDPLSANAAQRKPTPKAQGDLRSLVKPHLRVPGLPARN